LLLRRQEHAASRNWKRLIEAMPPMPSPKLEGDAEAPK
jgi:hypothetical protein